MGFKNVIGAVVGLVIGLSLFPVVNDTVNGINGTTGVTSTMLDLLPLMYVIILVAACAGYIYQTR